MCFRHQLPIQDPPQKPTMPPFIKYWRGVGVFPWINNWLWDGGSGQAHLGSSRPAKPAAALPKKARISLRRWHSTDETKEGQAVMLRATCRALQMDLPCLGVRAITVMDGRIQEGMRSPRAEGNILPFHTKWWIPAECWSAGATTWGWSY